MKGILTKTEQGWVQQGLKGVKKIEVYEFF